MTRDEPGAERIPRKSDRRNPVDEEAAKYEHNFRSRPRAELVNRAQTLYPIFKRRNMLGCLFAMHGSTWGSDLDNDDTEKSDMLAGSVTFKEGELEQAIGSVLEGSKGDDDAGSDYYRGLAQGGGPPCTRNRPTGDFMKDLLVHKCRKRRKARVPLADRIANFYDEIEQYKMKDDVPVVMDEWERQRRWTLLTKGVKAALAESSDEEENGMNTV